MKTATETQRTQRLHREEVNYQTFRTKLLKVPGSRLFETLCVLLTRETDPPHQILEPWIVAQGPEFGANLEPNQPVVPFAVKLFEELKDSVNRSQRKMD